MNVNELGSIEQLGKTGFTGTDADLETSLFEYRLCWKETSPKKWLFVYPIGGCDDEGIFADSQFERTELEDDGDIKSEFNWVDWDSLLSSLGMTFDEWDAMEFPQKIYDLQRHWGWENVFGSLYWEGFKIALEWKD